MNPQQIRENRSHRNRRTVSSLVEQGFHREESEFAVQTVGAHTAEAILAWARQTMIESKYNWLDMMSVFDGDHVDYPFEYMKGWLAIWSVSPPPRFEGCSYRDVLTVAMVFIHGLYRIDVGRVTPYFLPFPAIQMILTNQLDLVSV